MAENKRAKKNIPQNYSGLFKKKNYVRLVILITLISTLVFITNINSFGIENEYYLQYLKFISFVDLNGSVNAKLDIRVNESKVCLVSAVFDNQTNNQTFKLNEGLQQVYMPLPELGQGKTKVEFFLKCNSDLVD
jgi:hypothetical protein